MKAKDYNSVKWDDYFYASEDSESGLKWRVEIRGGWNNSVISVKIGDDAGHAHKLRNGRYSGWAVKLNGSVYSVHRILIVLWEGWIDQTKVVDHLNGNPLDNRKINLVLKTQQGNSQNRQISKSSSTGLVGVRFSTRVNKSGTIYSRWKAEWIGANGKGCSKSFPVDRYGHDLARKMATDYRNLQVSILNSKGADYTQRHQSSTLFKPVQHGT